MPEFRHSISKNTMSSHRQRMNLIGATVVPRVGTEARKRLDAYIEENKNNPEHKKRLKQLFDDALALIQVQQRNGAGFSADVQLREYNLEYNGRVINGSLRDMPSSFNVVEAFHKYLLPSSTFALRKENDHLFSFEEFIDWVTSTKTSESSEHLKEALTEEEIYSFNSMDKASELLFKNGSGRGFGFSSVSMIRIGSEVSALMLVGESCDLAEQTRKMSEEPEFKTSPHRAHIKVDEGRARRAEPLPSDESLWKTVVLLRFDVEMRTIDVSYVYQDCGDTYVGKINDISAYLDENGDFRSEAAKTVYLDSMEIEVEYGVLFDLCKTCLLLPSYFSVRDDDVEIERHPTDFKEYRTSLKNRKIFERVAPLHWVSTRDVRVLRKASKRYPDRASFVPPDYKVERSGYWRKLDISTEGADKKGHPITGRTWVNKTLSWREAPNEGGHITAARPGATLVGDNPGTIYVMRSAAHPKDVFKVGLTRRTSDLRASELSGSTSSPDHFLVVEEWNTSDCVLAEKLIHQALDAYRINPGREYFQAPYKTIFRAIDEVIETVGAGMPPQGAAG
jgi:hypothetical protein